MVPIGTTSTSQAPPTLKEVQGSLDRIPDGVKHSDIITLKMQKIYEQYVNDVAEDDRELKLRAIVGFVQKIVQINPYGGKIAVCEVLLNRLLHEQGFPLAMLFDSFRFRGLSLDECVQQVKVAQQVFVSTLKVALQIAFDAVNPDDMKEKQSFYTAIKIPNLDSDRYFQFLTGVCLENAARLELEHKKQSLSQLLKYSYGIEDLGKILRNAVAKGQARVVDIMIQHTDAANYIDRQDDNPKVGRTALHWAVLKSQRQIVLLLLVAGARTDIPDNAEKKTAEEYASTYSMDDLFKKGLKI